MRKFEGVSNTMTTRITGAILAIAETVKYNNYEKENEKQETILYHAGALNELKSLTLEFYGDEKNGLGRHIIKNAIKIALDAIKACEK